MTGSRLRGWAPLACGLSAVFAAGLATPCAFAATAPAPLTVTLPSEIDAYRAKLPEIDRELQPNTWAQTEVALGVALATRGAEQKGDAGVDSLNEAVAAFGESLEVFTREASPKNWALVKKNIATAQASLGARSDGTGSLGELQIAAGSYREALEVYSRETDPEAWAEIQLSLGAVLNMIGAQLTEGDRTAMLTQSADASRAALLVYTHTKTPAEWSAGQNALGVALKGLADVADPPQTNPATPAKLELLTQAADAHGQALTVLTRRTTPAEWLNTTFGLEFTNAAIADGKRDQAMMRRTIKEMDALIDSLKGAEAAAWLETAKANREEMKKDLAILLQPRRAPGGEAALRRDIDGLQRREPIYDEMTPVLVALIRPQIAQLEAKVAALGALQSVTFKGFAPGGQDVYEIVFAKGRSLWGITMAPDGKIKDVVLMPDS